MSAFESASFRFPVGLRERLAAEARLAGRSLNAEVVWRLSGSLGERDGVGGASLSRSPSDGPLGEGDDSEGRQAGTAAATPPAAGNAAGASLSPSALLGEREPSGRETDATLSPATDVGAGSASVSRSHSASRRDVVGANPASRSPNSVCVHGLAAGVCLRPECKR